MDKLSQENQGHILIAGEILLWSFFPIISILALSGVSPMFAAGASSIIAGFIFLITTALKNKLHLIKTCTVWKEIFLATFFVGILYYALMFYGMSLTTAGNTIIFSQFQVLFTFLILNIILKHEPLVKSHIFGAIFMVLGAIIILFPRGEEFGIKTGDLIIILATMCTPLGNLYAQKATKQVGSVFLMMIRSFIAGTCLLTFSFLQDFSFPTLDQTIKAIPFLAINGIFLLGLSKILFLESIRRLPISKCIALGVTTPALTLIFAYFILNEVPTASQLIGLIPIAIGVLLLVKKNRAPITK